MRDNARKKLILIGLMILIVLIISIIFIKVTSNEDKLKSKDNNVILEKDTKVFGKI